MDDTSGNSESSYFDATAEPEDQVQERNAEKAMVLGGAELLELLITHWEEKKRYYETIDSIGEGARGNGRKLILALEVNEGMRNEVNEELTYLKDLKKTYIDKA